MPGVPHNRSTTTTYNDLLLLIVDWSNEQTKMGAKVVLKGRCLSSLSSASTSFLFYCKSGTEAKIEFRTEQEDKGVTCSEEGRRRRKEDGGGRNGEGRRRRWRQNPWRKADRERERVQSRVQSRVKAVSKAESCS